MDYRESHQELGDDYDGRIASDPFDTYMNHWEARHVRDLLSARFPQRIPRYLDFACGTGRLTSVIAPLAVEAVGVDISASMLKIAATKVPAARFVCGDLTSEDHKLGQFDVVSAFRFFGNAQPDLRAAVLRALNPLVRPGGFLLINNHRNPLAIASVLNRVFSREKPSSDPSTKVGKFGMTLSHRTLRRILGEHGFSVEDERPIAVWQYRASIMATAGSDPATEERMERRFGGRAWVQFAPDTVILARKQTGV